MGKKKYKFVEESVDLKEEHDIQEETAPQDGIKKKIKVRARKLFHPFMSYLKSYQEFAQHLPRRFMEFDEEKLAEEEENIEEEKSDGNEDSGDEQTVDKIDRKKGPQFGSATRAKTIAELKERLAKMRGKKLDYQERLKKKGIKSRLTKKERLEERAKLKKEKMKAKKTKGNLTKPTASEDEKADVKSDVPKKPLPEPKMVFSKLELPEEEKFKKKVNKDPKRMLQKIQKSQAKLKMLEEKGKVETVKKIKEKLTWDKAIQKAEGVKLKDDVELLKKTIRRKTEIKNKSKKKWDQRKESVEHRKEEAQKKRKENITKKKKEKKTKKIKKSIKKGRVVI
uniref:Surfeit locus protein 6 n=1 Tax=Lygus hesperus TaxID=30085 RepID=A0A146LX86_LYGHE